MKKHGRPSAQLSKVDIQPLVQLLQVGKTRDVISRAKKLLKRHPTAPVLLDLISKAYMSDGDVRAAAAILEKLLTLEPNYVDGEYNLGVAYVNLDRPAEALPRLLSVIKKTGGSADAYTNLGAAYFGLEQFDEAADAYKLAVEKDPKFIPALRNLGNTLRTLKRVDESVPYLEKIPLLAPRFAAGHLSLGVSHARLGNVEKAQKCFETCLKLEPENREALYEIGLLNVQANDFDAAIAAFEKVDTEETRVKVLELMHQQDADRTALIQGVENLAANEPKNLRGAAFSAFVSNQYGVEDKHPFAPSPLELVSIRSLESRLEDKDGFLNALMSEASDVGAVWENNTTRGGFQTQGNLFARGENLKRLEALIREELKAYLGEHDVARGGLFRHFPKQYELHGWHVKLLKAGFQKPHIHPRGWISGVFYLKVPKDTADNEGGVAFSLHGYDYRKEHDDIPRREHVPVATDLVLFPSSLFHHTIPFESNEDRQCIAFDVLPV